VSRRAKQEPRSQGGGGLAGQRVRCGAGAPGRSARREGEETRLRPPQGTCMYVQSARIKTCEKGRWVGENAPGAREASGRGRSWIDEGIREHGARISTRRRGHKPQRDGDANLNADTNAARGAMHMEDNARGARDQRVRAAGAVNAAARGVAARRASTPNAIAFAHFKVVWKSYFACSRAS
jgi:hypothetical protein